MVTFTDNQDLFQKITGDYTAASLAQAKEDMNESADMFVNGMGRKFRTKYLKTNLVANQQFYQMPYIVLRITEVRTLNGTNWSTPKYVANEEQWNDINSIVSSSTVPLYYFIRGNNEVGFYPVPSAAVDKGLSISYEPAHIDLSQDDYVAGTVTVANNSTTLTHSASGFLPQMVGRYLQVTDGTDGKWYRIASYTSSSVLQLENFYDGISGSGRSFRIGECFSLPNGYQNAPTYMAISRWYDTKSDDKAADRYEARFTRLLTSARTTYGRATSRMGVKTKPTGSRRPTWLDLTKPVIYP